MKKNAELMANGQAVRMMKINGADFICLTNIVRFKNPEFHADVVRNWMRSKMTVAFLGLWEQLHNPDFNMVEFDQFKNEAGTNSFVLPPQVWIERTGAIGIMSKSGRYGEGNQRDYATINQLICISNMENINAVMINENAPQKREAFLREAAQRARRASARAQRSGRKEPRIPQPQRLKKLNEIAIQQMRILSEVEGRKYLK